MLKLGSTWPLSTPALDCTVAPVMQLCSSHCVMCTLALGLRTSAIDAFIYQPGLRSRQWPGANHSGRHIHDSQAGPGLCDRTGGWCYCICQKAYLHPSTRCHWCQQIAYDSWILMQRAPGKNASIHAGQKWAKELEREQSASSSHSFNSSESWNLRSQGWIGSCTKQGPAYDHRLNNGRPCGTFASVREFHDFLVAPVKQCPYPHLAAKFRASFSDDHRVHFAHADLSYDHVMVDPVTGAVTGILDWEMAGFWPEWWEYRKALFCSRQRRWWTDVVREIMPCYQRDLEAEGALDMFRWEKGGRSDVGMLRSFF